MAWGGHRELEHSILTMLSLKYLWDNKVEMSNQWVEYINFGLR